MAPHDWNAESYDRVAAGVVEMGEDVLERLSLAGDEVVLDAGCGPGTLTDLLVEMVPDGRVVGVDASPAMVELARKRLGGSADVLLDDLAWFEAETEFDVVFSAATFHWIADHDSLFGSMRGALRDGGRMVAQCGGAGNVTAVVEAIAQVVDEEHFADHLGGFDPWTFAGPDETRKRLIRAGFSEAECWLEDRSVRPEEPAEYLRTVMLGAHIELLPADLAGPFADAVLAALPDPARFDYVRLNIDAVA